MYCNIIINRPFNQPFTYDVGSSKVKKGQIVEVPFGNSLELGMIISTNVLKPNYKIKKVSKIFKSICLDDSSIKFIKWINEYTLAPIGLVLKLFIVNDKIINFKFSTKKKIIPNFTKVKLNGA